MTGNHSGHTACQDKELDMIPIHLRPRFDEAIREGRLHYLIHTNDSVYTILFKALDAKRIITFDEKQKNALRSVSYEFSSAPDLLPEKVGAFLSCNYWYTWSLRENQMILVDDNHPHPQIETMYSMNVDICHPIQAKPDGYYNEADHEVYLMVAKKFIRDMVSVLIDFKGRNAVDQYILNAETMLLHRKLSLVSKKLAVEKFYSN